VLTSRAGAPTGETNRDYGASRQRPWATNAARSATTTFISATETTPPAHMTTVAPIMMITSPAAASGVRPGRMRRSPGRHRSRHLVERQDQLRATGQQKEGREQPLNDPQRYVDRRSPA
jgi:hypothetical protein